jgi:hypothetical protein
VAEAKETVAAATKAADQQTTKAATATEKSKEDAEAELVNQAQCCIIL